MAQNPYESPAEAPAKPLPARMISFTSAKIWLMVLAIAMAIAAASIVVHRSLPRDRILPDRLDANQSDLIHTAVAVVFLASGATAAVSAGAMVLAVIQRR